MLTVLTHDWKTLPKGQKDLMDLCVSDLMDLCVSQLLDLCVSDLMDLCVSDLMDLCVSELLDLVSSMYSRTDAGTSFFTRAISISISGPCKKAQAICQKIVSGREIQL